MESLAARPCTRGLYRDLCIALRWQLEAPTSSWSPSRWPDTPSCQLTSGACAGSFQLEVPVECRLGPCLLLLPGGLPFAMLPANGTLLTTVYGFDHLLVTSLPKLLDVGSFRYEHSLHLILDPIVHCVDGNCNNAAYGS